MLLRISHQRAGDSTVVTVEGTLSGSGVDELRSVCEAGGPEMVLDLKALLGADEVGIALLDALRKSGARIQNASPYVQLLLEVPFADRTRGNHVR